MCWNLDVFITRINIKCQLDELCLLSWQRLAETRTSRFGLISCAVAKRSVAQRCSSVCLERKADLFSFIDEKNCSQTYVLPNMAMILAAASKSFGKCVLDKYV